VVSGASDVAADFRSFLTRRDGDREQPALYVRPLAAAPRSGAEPIVCSSIRSRYGERGGARLVLRRRRRGRYLAYGISTNGDERSTLRVMETATGRTSSPDAIEHTKWSDVAWLHAEDGFYYRRYPLRR
jgi:prolyl oligopeptidase